MNFKDTEEFELAIIEEIRDVSVDSPGHRPTRQQALEIGEAIMRTSRLIELQEGEDVQVSHIVRDQHSEDTECFASLVIRFNERFSLAYKLS